MAAPGIPSTKLVNELLGIGKETLHREQSRTNLATIRCLWFSSAGVNSISPNFQKNGIQDSKTTIDASCCMQGTRFLSSMSTSAVSAQ